MMQAIIFIISGLYLFLEPTRVLSILGKILAPETKSKLGQVP